MSSSSTAVTIAETAPFIIVLILELMGRDIGSKWTTVYESYKQEDDIELHITSDKRKEALKDDLKQYTQYSHAYIKSVNYLSVSLFSVISILISRKTRGEKWLGTLILSLIVFAALAFLIGSFFDNHSPHNYDSKSLLGITISGWTVVIINVLIILVIVFF